MILKPRRRMEGIVRNLVFLFLCALPFSPLEASETLRIQSEKPRELSGRVLMEGEEGELAFQARDGRIFLFAAGEILSRESDSRPFTPYTKEEMRDILAEEFGSEFSVLTEGQYVLVYNTSKDYAQWCATLFSRLFETYKSVWSKFGLDLKDPEFPFVAILFANKEQFNAYGTKTLQDRFHPQMNAFFDSYSNRIVFCDLSGKETQQEDSDREKLNSRQIRNILEREGAGFNVSAIMHEAAHQIGYNDGMFRRLSNTPVWLAEGIAMMHELPDIHNPRINEKGEPRINKQRLRQLRNYLSKNPANPVRDLVLSDKPILSMQTAVDNYGLSWGLCYYLYKNKPREFSRYLKLIAKKGMFEEYPPEERLHDFETHFGNNWAKFNRNFLRFLSNLH